MGCSRLAVVPCSSWYAREWIAGDTSWSRCARDRHTACSVVSTSGARPVPSSRPRSPRSIDTDLRRTLLVMPAVLARCLPAFATVRLRRPLAKVSSSIGKLERVECSHLVSSAPTQERW